MSQTYSYSFIFFHPNRELKNQSISIVVALLPELERNAIFRRICTKNQVCNPKPLSSPFLSLTLGNPIGLYCLVPSSGSLVFFLAPDCQSYGRPVRGLLAPGPCNINTGAVHLPKNAQESCNSKE